MYDLATQGHALFSHLSAYSQSLEYDAEAHGTAAAIEAGYDPQAGVHALERFDTLVNDQDPDRRQCYPTHPPDKRPHRPPAKIRQTRHD